MSVSSDEKVPGRKAFILGLDGVPWDLLTEWVTETEFPNFYRVLNEGVSGPLESTTPAVTPLAWPSIATGVWPDKHGVYGFQELTSEYTHRMYTNKDLRQPPLWEIIPSSMVCNVPVTYPATKIDGELIAGTMTPTMNDEYTYPPELSEEIASELPDHQISLRWGEYLDRKDEFVEEIEALVESRRELLDFFSSRSQDWQLFFFTVMAPDRLQHLVWDEEVLKKHYKQLDALLGDVLEIVELEEANLFVVSDHGFGPVSKTVCVNHILEANGYLVRQETGARTVLEKLGITKTRLRELLTHLGIDEHTLIKNYLPRPVVDQLAANVPGEHTVYDIDPEETQAVVHGMGNVYINSTDRFREGSVPAEEITARKHELKQLFSSYTDPDTLEQPLEVHDGETLFPTDPSAPDLVLEPQAEYTLSTSLTETSMKEPEEDADHRKHGVFLTWGPDIAQMQSVEDVSVVDVAPTVLHSFGVPIPEQADGRVIQDVFKPGSRGEQMEIETREYFREQQETQEPQAEDMEQVKDRLKGLGYMEN